MEATLHRSQEDHKTVGSRVAAPLTRLKKRTYVLPSGRVLKVVVYDEREILASAA
jgi:hypothetical protein